MEEITSNGLIAILASIFSTFCLGAALVLFCKHDTEKQWKREMDRQMND